MARGSPAPCPGHVTRCELECLVERRLFAGSRVVSVPSGRAVPGDRRWRTADMRRVSSSWRTERSSGPIGPTARRNTYPWKVTVPSGRGAVRPMGDVGIRNRRISYHCSGSPASPVRTSTARRNGYAGSGRLDIGSQMGPRRVRRRTLLKADGGVAQTDFRPKCRESVAVSQKWA